MAESSTTSAVTMARPRWSGARRINERRARRTNRRLRRLGRGVDGFCAGAAIAAPVAGAPPILIVVMSGPCPDTVIPEHAWWCVLCTHTRSACALDKRVRRARERAEATRSETKEMPVDEPRAGSYSVPRFILHTISPVYGRHCSEHLALIDRSGRFERHFPTSSHCTGELGARQRFIAMSHRDGPTASV